MAYSDEVLEHYHNPRNVGSFDDNDLEVGTAIIGAPECGDVLKLQIRIRNDIIIDAKFKTFGCGSAIASSSLATEMLKGMSLHDATSQISNQVIAKALKLSPVKIHCSVLAQDAIREAINNYRDKNGIKYS